MTVRRNLPPPAVELRLTGFLTEPDPSAANRMAAFDALSLGLRRELEECPFDFNAHQALAAVRDRGGLATLRLIRVSVARERQLWVRDRDAALVWARDAFRNGPRPKHEPPPGGWSVHNFPG
jgi:hypothetical protein